MFDCVVVGAGPAGLSASAALAARGVAHVVLERGRAGETWRTQRWGSFRLNTPGWMNPALGAQERESYATRAEVVERLETLAADCPIREVTPVARLARAGAGWVLRTAAGDLRARAVVVATGDQNTPKVPALARAVPARVAQYHAGDYRTPGLLPAGSVLVVGSGQSGCQIAADLLGGGRRVLLATSPVGRLPCRYRGRGTYEWLVELGFYDQRPGDLTDPSLLRAPNPVIGGGGHSLSLQALARRGVTLVGRPVAIAGDRLTFDDSVHANIAAGDAFAAWARGLVDDLARRRGGELPPAEADPTDTPVEISPPATLDLRAEEVTSVVWCTGFDGDFSWVDPGLVGPAGQPRHDGTAAAAPGVWYVGLRWLVCRGSSILRGFPQDAATVAGEVEAYLGGVGPGHGS
ncbi:NAD(P)-binding domain-containing protein [Planosporangium thailandense]|uniref:NAD(P)-binding domain-containing protein n=1 Tax=Planosporangium thailandense TaxID=765197 RepID=A0ABX0XRH9_9ACTN|nr:NAD(P)-binding domain-containing protein [Planosporangium thailandense]